MFWLVVLHGTITLLDHLYFINTGYNHNCKLDCSATEAYIAEKICLHFRTYVQNTNDWDMRFEVIPRFRV